MHLSSRIMWFPVVIALGGCSAAAPAEPDQEATTSEELSTNNRTADFQIGVLVVNYDAAGHAIKSIEVATDWASRIQNEFWTQPVSILNVDDPTGIRIHLVPNLPSTTGTIYHYVDFRIGIRASEGVASPPQWTAWASEIVGPTPQSNAWEAWSDAAMLPSGKPPSAYLVGVATRLWTNTHRRIWDFRIGVRAIFQDHCGADFHDWGAEQWTPWAVSEGGGWSHTAGATPGSCTNKPPNVQQGMGIGIETSYENF
jgi:hypothetical protein